jgi:hypothetical protein
MRPARRRSKRTGTAGGSGLISAVERCDAEALAPIERVPVNRSI